MWGRNIFHGVTGRLATSVPVFTLFIELADGTPLQVGLIIILSENPAKKNRRENGATNEIAEFQTKVDYAQTNQ